MQGPQGLHLLVKEEAFREGLMKEQINGNTFLTAFSGLEISCSLLFFKIFVDSSFIQGGKNFIPLCFQHTDGL